MVKRTLLYILILAFIAAPSLAHDLLWEYTGSENQITGFIIYYKDVADPTTEYSHVVPDASARQVSDVIETLTLIRTHQYDFQATTYSTENGESERSNTVTWLVPDWEPPSDTSPTRIELTAPGELRISAPAGTTILIP